MIPLLRTGLVFFLASSLLQALPEFLDGGPQPLKPAEYRVGELIPDLGFTDLDGKPGRLSDYRSYQALVIALNLVDCPLCGKLMPSLQRLQKEYETKQVAFLMVNGTPEASLAELRATVKKFGITARYLPDLDHALGKALGARTSTDVFILDRARTLVYRGPVSDQFGIGYDLPSPHRKYLTDAIEAVLAKKSVAMAALSSPGCALGIDTSPAPESGATFHNRVSRLVQRNCQSCHRPGESAPFSLFTFNDVLKHAPMIHFVLDHDIMPPWFASPDYGHWANDRSLTARDKRALLSWLDSGMPQGDPKDAPLPLAWTDGWSIGEPDMVIELPQPIAIPAEGVMPYQYVTVALDLPSDKWVRAVEIRNTHPEVSHHVLVMIKDPKDPGRGAATNDLGEAIDGYLAGRVPGQGAVVFPRGTARLLRHDAQLLFQLHYTPNGVAVEDRPKLGLIFGDGPPEREEGAFAIYDTKFVIPPMDPNYAVSAEMEVSKAMRLISFMPHMHLRGKSFRFEVTYPDEHHEILLEVPKYDFNWQLRYEARAPIEVPAGSRIRATGWYDNSDKNPHNPDPHRAVPYGEQTTDEMMIGFLEWEAVDSPSPLPLPLPLPH